MKQAKFFITSILIILSSLCIAKMDTVQPWLSLLKCLLLAYGICFLTYALLERKIKKQIHLLYYGSCILLILYTILAIDTYLIHAITWFPGILRYALFSTYGWWYLLFALLGMGICFKRRI